jgi:hypothetical protein
MTKIFVSVTTIFMSAVAVARADIRPIDAKGPVLQYYQPIQLPPSKEQPGVPNFTIDEKKPLLTINSLRDLIVDPGGKGVTAILNEKDKRRFAQLTHQFVGQILICTGTDNFTAIGSITSPTNDGVLYFSENRHTAETAKYLRRRFGK